MSIYFISDLHLGHENCLRLDSRPFSSIEEQDEVIVQNWNNRVKSNDEVWILGDVSFYRPGKTVEILKRLNGIKRLCRGNHDTAHLRKSEFRECFAEIVDYKKIHLGKGLGIICSHYPIPCFDMHRYGWLHLYGHVHNSPEWYITQQMKFMVEQSGTLCRMYNVGCMMPYINYTPRTYEEIIIANERGI